MSAEFYGIHGYADPGPKPFVKAEGRRKLVVQLGASGDTVRVPADRQEQMSILAARAVGVFASSGRAVEWHTLTFRVDRTGMELLPDEEFWRWEVWAE